MAAPPVRYQTVPQNAQILDPDGRMNQTWYRFFVTLAGMVMNSVDPTTGDTTVSPTTLSLAGVSVGYQDADAALQAQVTTANGHITTLQAQVATLQAQVSALQAQVAALEAQVDGATVVGLNGTAHTGAGGGLPAQVTSYLDFALGATHYRVPLYLP